MTLRSLGAAALASLAAVAAHADGLCGGLDLGHPRYGSAGVTFNF